MRVAHTKFMYWLKKNISKEQITELSASDKLEEFRKEQEGYICGQVLIRSVRMESMQLSYIFFLHQRRT